MVKVENKETLRLLTGRFMKMNKGRNIIAVLAIMLTSLLFTSLFSGSVSLILSRRATEVKQFMESSHASAQDLSEEEGERIEKVVKESKEVERYGKGIFLGSGVDERFSFSSEVRYGDKNLAESFNCMPTTGRMPEEKDEIAVSTLVLDALELPHKLGEEITVTWQVHTQPDEYKTDTFRLCGYWKGDKAVMSQLLWVSEDYASKNCYPVTKEELENGDLNGGRDYCVWYKNLWNLQKKTKELSKEAGFSVEGTGLEVNPAYDLMEEDSFSFSSVAVMVLFVILAGYLIIYNIFNISIKTDIRAYGLLKNVGTTGKQLKRIVRMQAWRLSALGIPIGLILGYGASILMAPTLNTNAEISAQAEKTTETVVSANPAIFIAAGLLTLLTVYLSSIQACKIVERVSPVEALRLAESDKTTRKTKKNIMKSTSASWYGMAFQNMLRNWSKGLIVMLSIALSVVVVNCIVILVQGYDFDMYRKIYLEADFQLDQLTGDFRNSNLNGIAPKIRSILKECPDSQATGYVYYSEEEHELEEHTRSIVEDFVKKYEDDLSGYEKELWNEVADSNVMKVHLIGVSEFIFEKLEWKEQPCTWEEFKTGDYVVVDYSDKYSEKPTSYYQVGENFRMEYKNGKEKQYQVLGEALMPYSLDYPYADFLYLTVIVPEEEFIKYTGNDCAMIAALDAKKGKDIQLKNYIEKTVLKENDMINVFSVVDMKESFQRYLSKYYIIGGFLVVILGFIGIMNFFNTTATSVLSRKKELALLEAVGMTKRQITKMLVAEGCIYLIGAFLIAVLIVVFGAGKILSNTVGNAFFFRVHITVVPCIVMFPILLVIAYVIPKYQFEKINKESVVERICS